MLPRTFANDYLQVTANGSHALRRPDQRQIADEMGYSAKTDVTNITGTLRVSPITQAALYSAGTALFPPGLQMSAVRA